jgi:predicted metal-binding membrane protein
MLVLFVAGSMSLVWMGGLSIAIFVEKVGLRPRLVSRAIGVVLVALGAALAYATIVAM